MRDDARRELVPVRGGPEVPSLDEAEPLLEDRLKSIVGRQRAQRVEDTASARSEGAGEPQDAEVEMDGLLQMAAALTRRVPAS